jgi:hypothetical protein
VVYAENVRNQHHSLRHRPKPRLFSAAPDPASFGLSRRHFGEGLWTAHLADSRFRFSDGPVFSGALYFSDSVQSLKSPIDRHLLKGEFETALAVREAILIGGLSRGDVGAQVSIAPTARPQPSSATNSAGAAESWPVRA